MSKPKPATLTDANREAVDDLFNLINGKTSTPNDNDDPYCQCDNCRELNRESDLNEIKDFHQRVEPGEICPAGECPECGCLAHIIDDQTAPRYLAQWTNGDDIDEGDDNHCHAFSTFDEARDCVLAQLEDVQIGYHGSDTESLAEMICEKYADASLAFETKRVGGYVYNVSKE